MSFGQSVSYCLSNYANFNGRARRSEFWWFYLFIALVQLGLYLATILVSALVRGTVSDSLFAGLGISAIWIVIAIALAIPLYAAGSRRLHDTGKSGWMQLLLLIPCVGPILLIVFWAQQGQPADNQYGAPPA